MVFPLYDAPHNFLFGQSDRSGIGFEPNGQTGITLMAKNSSEAAASAELGDAYLCGNDAALGRLTALASTLFDVSFAAIALIEDDHIILKSAIEADQPKPPVTTERTQELDALLRVGDVNCGSSNGHNESSPLDISGLPALRFYTACALVMPGGSHIGTFIIGHDEARRPLNTPEQVQWQHLAQMALHELAQQQNIARLEAQQREAQRAERTIEMALELSQMASWQLDLKSGKISWGGASESVWGLDGEQIPQNEQEVFALIHPDDRMMVRQALGRAIADQNETYDVEFRIAARSGEVRWLAGRGDWVRLRNRETLTGINFDITDIVRQQERNLLHNRELHHRLRNLFAKLQSIINLTQPSARSVDDYAERITGRLTALERAQKILLATDFMSGSLYALVSEFTDGDHRITAQGDSVQLGENAIVSLSLILNELASNAARYGALRDVAGRVTIIWTMAGDNLRLVWQEYNGEAQIAVHDEMVTGFGSALIDQSICGNLGGSVEREWHSSGLQCTLQFPIEQ